METIKSNAVIAQINHFSSQNRPDPSSVESIFLFVEIKKLQNLAEVVKTNSCFITPAFLASRFELLKTHLENQKVWENEIRRQVFLIKEELIALKNNFPKEHHNLMLVEEIDELIKFLTTVQLYPKNFNSLFLKLEMERINAHFG